MGNWGWIGSGSDIFNAIFRKPEVYHVGIAMAPSPSLSSIMDEIR